MIDQVCPRCASRHVEARDDTFFVCRDCGKADKRYLLHLSFPDEGSVRNYPRELAGAFTEKTVPGIYRILHNGIKDVWSLDLPDRVEAEALDAVIGGMLDGLLKHLLAYFPAEITSNALELSELFNKYSRMQALQGGQHGEREGDQAGDPVEPEGHQGVVTGNGGSGGEH